MPILKYLADTNAVSDYFRPGNPVKDWFANHPGEIGISVFTLAEMRRGIELRGDTKARLALERIFKFVVEDYHEAVMVFDEAAAVEWGRLMAQTNQPIPYDDSLIAAIARSCDLIVVTRNEKHFPGCETVNPWTA
jgi:predicted nucleic acid-binding protein